MEKIKLLMKEGCNNIVPFRYNTKPSSKLKFLLVIPLFCMMRASLSQSVVEHNGRLRVEGSKIVNQHNESVSFAGNSFFWSNDNWGGEKYYTESVVQWLKDDWKSTIVRASMGVEDAGGYIDNPSGNKEKMKIVVDAAIEAGLYVIIDWHSHHAEDYQEEAVAFFVEMASTYGHYDHVIYEIYNEPLQVSWSNTVKPYAETVISAIREIDEDNLIIVGSPEWSQKVDLVANDPIQGFTNIAYTLHFYSIWHHQWLRNRASEALNKGIALFATEWGALGDTPNDPETEAWMEWCRENQISHCNWAINDKVEPWSALKPGSSTSGGWSDSDLTISGALVKSIIRGWPSTVGSVLSTPLEGVKNNIYAYPNPSSTQLKIPLQNVTKKRVSFTVTDASGRRVESDVLWVEQLIELDISSYQTGFYRILLEIGGHHMSTAFVKQ